MKKTMTFLLLATAAMGFKVQAAPKKAACSNATLSGTYAYILNGLKKHKTFLHDDLEMGFETYDGKGHITSIVTDAYNRATYQLSGTYQVDQNCQASVNYGDTDEKFTMFVSPSGDDFYYMEIDDTAPGQAIAGREHRLTKTQTVSCSTATLKGVYSYAARGIKRGGIWIETGFEYFDGNGNVVNVFENSRNKTVEYFRGSYSVNDNCLGVATYPDTETVERYAMYVSPVGDEFSWMQIDGIQLLGWFGGVEKRASRNIKEFPELAAFAASGAPVPQNVTANMVCNMPETIPENVTKAGIEIICGSGYQLTNGICQINPQQMATGHEHKALAGAPAALCPPGVMLKNRE